MFTTIEQLLPPIRSLHEQIRDAVVTACERSAVNDLAAIAKEEAGDTIYAIDKISEELLVEFFTKEVAVHTPIVLIGEGLEPHGQHVLPEGGHRRMISRTFRMGRL